MLQIFFFIIWSIFIFLYSSRTTFSFNPLSIKLENPLLGLAAVFLFFSLTYIYNNYLAERYPNQNLYECAAIFLLALVLTQTTSCNKVAIDDKSIVMYADISVDNYDDFAKSEVMDMAKPGGELNLKFLPVNSEYPVFLVFQKDDNLILGRIEPPSSVILHNHVDDVIDVCLSQKYFDQNKLRAKIRFKEGTVFPDPDMIRDLIKRDDIKIR